MGVAYGVCSKARSGCCGFLLLWDPHRVVSTVHTRLRGRERREDEETRHDRGPGIPSTTTLSTGPDPPVCDLFRPSSPSPREEDSGNRECRSSWVFGESCEGITEITGVTVVPTYPRGLLSVDLRSRDSVSVLYPSPSTLRKLLLRRCVLELLLLRSPPGPLVTQQLYFRPSFLVADLTYTDPRSTLSTSASVSFLLSLSPDEPRLGMETPRTVPVECRRTRTTTEE